MGNATPAATRDLSDAERDLLGNYGGNAGFKYGITVDGEHLDAASNSLDASRGTAGPERPGPVK